MPLKATGSYVTDALALQGADARPEDARAIAAALAAQLAAVTPAYAALPFEAEPSGFLLESVAERGR